MATEPNKPKGAKAKAESKTSPTHYTHPDVAKGPTYVPTFQGTKLVYPGETVQLVDLAGVVAGPAGIALVEAEPADQAKLVELQKRSIEAIKAELAALTPDELDALLKLEQAATSPRVTLIAELEENILARKV